MRWHLLCAALLAGSLGACALAAPAPAASTQPPQATPTETPATPTIGMAELPRRTLALWVPARFSPDGPDGAGALLAERLDEFETAHPGVRVEVRVKPQSGPASLLVALTAAQQAAPSVLPDLVAFDAADLARAHEAGLINTWEDIADVPEAWGWTQAVVEGARIDGLLAGLPFAAQADVFAYRSVAYPTPPHGWADTLTGSGSFLFPAGDPWAEFTLAQYLSAGGTLRDADGQPALDTPALQDVLQFYSAARAAGLLPLSSRQHEASSTTLEPLTSGQVGASIVPFEQIPKLEALEIRIVGPWLSRDGRGTCFVKPWTWAVVKRSPEPNPLTTELATWLSRPEFAGPWTHALRLLPATSSALALWPNDGLRLAAESMDAACLPIPSPADLDRFGPALRDAVGATLTGELTPEQAAAAAAGAVARP